MLRKQSDRGSGSGSGISGGAEERRDGSSGESGKGHKRYLSLGEEEEEDVDDRNEAEGFEILENMGTRTEREHAQEKDRQRSESSLAFERALDSPRLHANFTDDALSGNVFDIACSMEDQRRRERREVASMWPLEDKGENRRSLYDEDGFLKDGQRSPERAPRAIYQN